MLRARLITLFTVAVAALALAGLAQAHVTVHPNALPSGGFTVVNLQVPNERPKASTVKVDVQIPPGVFFLSTAPIPGWTAKVYFTKLAKPVKVFDDVSTQQVSRVVWTAKLGKIGPGQFQSFPMSMLVPSVKAGTLLTFKALQTYSNGEVVRWIGPPSADEPAPQVIVSGANSAVQDYPAGVSAAKSRISKSVVIGVPFALLGALGIGILRRRKS
jgi:periplasmic copper chaperone A